MKKKRFILRSVCLFVLFANSVSFNAKSQNPGGVSGNLTSWFKANTTVPGNIAISTGNSIASWKSDFGTYSVSQGTQAYQPAFESTLSSIANFNFNPVVQFNSTAGNVLFNSSTTNDLLGTAGTMFLICNARQGTVNPNGNGLTYYSNSNYRYQMKPSFRIQVGTGSLGWTSDVNAAGAVPVSAPPESGFIIVSKNMGANFRARKNADSIPRVNAGSSTYFPTTQPGLFLGSQSSTPGSGFPYNGAISEVISFNVDLSAADINKVETYLAVKYGITLSQNSAYGPAYSNYTASNGTQIWNATANSGYAKNITGIGRDDASALFQKQSKSVHNNALVYLYNGNTGGSFPAMNTDNTSTFSSDLAFLLVGDNGLSNTPDQCFFNGKAQRMQRVWKANNTAAVSTITVAVDQPAVSAAIKNIIVSTDPTFPAAITAIRPLIASNGKLYAELTLNSNEYFSFSTDTIIVTMNATQPSCTNPNAGSVITGITGGNPPFVYSWSPSGQATADLTNVSAGTHILTVSQGTCQVTYQVTLVAPGAPFAPVVNAVSICAGSTATLSVQSPDATYTYSWYAAAAGGISLATGISYTTPAIPATTMYYVEASNGVCVSIRTAVTVTITTITDAAVSSTAICPGTTATLTVQNPVAGQTYNWFATAAGGTPLATGTSYTSPILNTATTYYVEASNGTCVGIRTAVTVSITTVTNAILNTLTICTGTTATLTVQNPVAGQTYNWYSSATGGTTIATGTSYTSPILNAAATYYVEAANGTCVGIRTAVTVSITTITNAVLNPLTICVGTTATLTVQNPVTGQTYNWYATAAGGTILATGTSYTSPALNTAITYYVEASSGSCVGIRNAVTVTVTTLTDAVVNSLTICQGNTATLTVQNPVAGQTYNWFEAATSGSSLSTGASYTSPVLYAATTYYVEAMNGTCTSRVPVIVSLTIVTPPTANGDIVCPGNSGSLSIQNPDGAHTYSWYNTATGGSLLATGSNYTSPAVSSVTSYYVESSNGTCSSIRTPVAVSIIPPLTTPIVTATAITQTSITFTWQPVGGASGYQVSVDGGPFTIPSSGTNGTIHTLTGLSLSQTVTIDVIALKSAGGCNDSNQGHAKATTFGSGFYMPTAFTPNGDMLNDIIKPHLPGGSQMTYFIIYNRWGQKIFSTSFNEKGWDGTSLGKLQENGVYVWVCKYIFINGKNMDEKGSFLLLR